MRRGLLALVLLGAMMLVPANAHALNVRQKLDIFIDAAPGEKNTVVWEETDTLGVLITDLTAPITMNGSYPCARVSLHTVACGSSPAIVHLGDKNDSFTAPQAFDNFDCGVCPPQFQVYGGDGADTIAAGVTASSSSYGEAGNDTIYADSTNGANVDGGDGNDTLVIPHGYGDRYYFGRMTCGAGTDRLVWSDGEDPPADCETVLTLPEAAKLLPGIPYLGLP